MANLAGRLVGLYFVFFKVCLCVVWQAWRRALDGCVFSGPVPPSAAPQTLVQNDQLDTKMLSAVLTGVNRAFPYTRGAYVPVPIPHALTTDAASVGVVVFVFLACVL